MTVSALTEPVRRVTRDAKLAVLRMFRATAHPSHDFEEWEADLGGPPTSKHLAARAAHLGFIVQGAQLAVGNLCTTHLSEKLGLARAVPLGDDITERANGIPKELVYQRPYRVAAVAYQDGASVDEAMAQGERRLNSLTGVDIQMSKVRQSQAVLKAAGRKTFHRVPTSDNPCELCELASDQTYYTEDLMPIHDSCSCEVEPGDEGDGDAPEVSDDDLKESDDYNPDGKQVEVREHGEVGPVLTWAHQNFQGPQDLPNPGLAFKANGDPLTRRGRSLTVDDADRQNSSARDTYRRGRADKLDAAGVEDQRRLDPRYADGVNVKSRYARSSDDDDE